MWRFSRTAVLGDSDTIWPRANSARYSRSSRPGVFRCPVVIGNWVYAPLGTPEADDYLDDMALGANFATVKPSLDQCP